MVLTLHKIRNLTFGQTKSGQQILNMCVLNVRQQNWIQMHNFQPQNANKLHVLVKTPSKFLITNDHLFWKESNMSLDDSTNILYMLKSPIIFSFLYPNAHVKLYFPVDHPWPQGLFVHLMICVSSEENSILLKKHLLDMYSSAHTQQQLLLQMYFWHVSTLIVCILAICSHCGCKK